MVFLFVKCLIHSSVPVLACLCYKTTEKHKIIVAYLPVYDKMKIGYTYYYVTSGAKGQKAVRACTIRRLNLWPAKHEEVAIYAVNLRIPNAHELRELQSSGAIRRYQVRGKIPFGPHILIVCIHKDDLFNRRII